MPALNTQSPKPLQDYTIVKAEPGFAAVRAHIQAGRSQIIDIVPVIAWKVFEEGREPDWVTLRSLEPRLPDDLYDMELRCLQHPDGRVWAFDKNRGQHHGWRFFPSAGDWARHKAQEFAIDKANYEEYSMLFYGVLHA